MRESISLIDAKEGREIKIISVEAGLQAAKRLSDLGLTTQTKIKILRVF